MSLWDKLGNTVDTISGTTRLEQEAAALEAQSNYNQELLAIEKQRQEAASSPEAVKLTRTKMIIFGVIVLFIIATVAVIIFKRK